MERSGDKKKYRGVAEEWQPIMRFTSGIEIVEERPPFNSEGFPHRRLRG
jgi:hypothetical protein